MGAQKNVGAQKQKMWEPKNKQARKPRSYASLKLRPSSDSLTYLLTMVKCRATSVAKNVGANKKTKMWEPKKCGSHLRRGFPLPDEQLLLSHQVGSDHHHQMAFRIFITYPGFSAVRRSQHQISVSLDRYRGFVDHGMSYVFCKLLPTALRLRFPNYIFAKYIFAKCTRLTHLLSFASLSDMKQQTNVQAAQF